MKMKTCFKCGRTLPIDEFYVHKEMGDGHLNKCKECTKRDVAERRLNNPDADLNTRLKACKKNPTHKNAYYVVDAALRAGVLTKPDVCPGCGCPSTKRRIEAHHHDYSKPLDVIWLCSACHARIDIMRRLEEQGLPIDEYQRQIDVLGMRERRALQNTKGALRGPSS